MEEEAESSRLPSSGERDLSMAFTTSCAKRSLESALISLSGPPKRHKEDAEAYHYRPAPSGGPNSLLPRIRTSLSHTLLPSTSSVDSDNSIFPVVCLEDVERGCPASFSTRTQKLEMPLSMEGRVRLVGRRLFGTEDTGRECEELVASSPDIPSARLDEPSTPRATSVSTSIFTPNRMQPQSTPSSPYAQSNQQLSAAWARACSPASTPSGQHVIWSAEGRGVLQQLSAGLGGCAPIACPRLSSPSSSLGVPDRMVTGRAALLSPQAPFSRPLLLPPSHQIPLPRIQKPATSVSTPLPWAHLTPGLSLHIPSSTPTPTPLKPPLPSAGTSSAHTPASPTSPIVSLSPGVWTLGKVGLSHQPSPSPMAQSSGTPNSSAIGSRCSSAGQRLAPSRFSQVHIRREAQLGFVLAASMHPSTCASASLPSAPALGHDEAGTGSSAFEDLPEEDARKAYRENVKRAFNQWLESLSKAPGASGC